MAQSPEDSNRPEIEAQLARILASRIFSTTRVAREFLRFLVVESLAVASRAKEESRAAEVFEFNETWIGVEHFKKQSGYDNSQDSIVRVNATRLRKKLRKYYATEGSSDPWIIDLPTDGYRPRIYRRPVDVAPESASLPSALTETAGEPISAGEPNHDLIIDLTDRGYRPQIHCGSVEVAPESPSMPATTPTEIAGEPISAGEQNHHRLWRFIRNPAILAALLLLAMLGGLAVIRPAAASVAIKAITGTPIVTRIVQLTHDGLIKQGPIWVLGDHIYFTEIKDGKRVLAWAGLSSDGAIEINSPPYGDAFDGRMPGPEFLSIEADRQGLLEAWIAGRAPRELFRKSSAAVWLDRGRFATVSNGRLLIVGPNGVEGAAVLPGPVKDLQWNGAQRAIRFTSYNAGFNHSSIWETPEPRLAPRRLNRFPPDAREGAWDSASHSFAFTVPRGITSDIWLENRGLLGLGTTITRLTDGSLDFHWPRPLSQGRIVAIGAKDAPHLMAYEAQSHQFRDFLSGKPFCELDFFLPGDAIAYVNFPERELWRSRLDGSGAVALYRGPIQVLEPRWSPNGSQIAFIGVEPQSGEHIYLIGSEGKAPYLRPERATDRKQSEGVPTWNADGSVIVFGDLHDQPKESMQIHLLDVRTRQVSKLADSDGLWTPRWSPDGKYIAALTYDFKAIRLYDWLRRRWKEGEIVRLDNIDRLQWSSDSTALYFTSLPSVSNRHPGQPIAGMYRFDVRSKKVELVADLDGYPPNELSWFGITPGGVPLQMWTDLARELYLIEYSY